MYNNRSLLYIYTFLSSSTRIYNDSPLSWLICPNENLPRHRLSTFSSRTSSKHLSKPTISFLILIIIPSNEMKSRINLFYGGGIVPLRLITRDLPLPPSAIVARGGTGNLRMESWKRRGVGNAKESVCPR